MLVKELQYFSKKFKDKIRVWFSPPAWRPDDVAEKYPVHKNDLDNFEKYDPEITTTEKVFAFFQFSMINGLTILMLFNVDKFSYPEMAGVAILVSTLAISNALLLDGRNYANNVEVIRACAVLVFIYLGFFTNFVYLILAHSIIALIVASVLSLGFNQLRTAR